MNFIAIDFGNYTGYSFFENWQYKKSYSFKILTEQSTLPIEIIDTFFNKIKDKIDMIDCFVVEDYAYSRGFFNANQSEMIGAFKYKVFKEIKKHIYFVNISTARKILLDDGRATKSKIRKFVKYQVGELNNQHEYDSVFIGFAFRELFLKNKEFSDAMRRRSIIFDKNLTKI